MWTLRGQFSIRQFDATNLDLWLPSSGKPRTEGPLEWSEIIVDTQEEAEEWWKCRTSTNCKVNRVSTMFDPNGVVVKVAFN